MIKFFASLLGIPSDCDHDLESWDSDEYDSFTDDEPQKPWWSLW